MIIIYTFLANILHSEYDELKLLKKNPRGSVHLLRHKISGKKLTVRHFTENTAIYEKLLNYSCSNLPKIYEVAKAEKSSLIVEEYIEGDTLSFLLKDVQFTPRETRQIAKQICKALWVLHSLNAVHRDVKPENIILRGSEAILIDFDAARICKEDCVSDTQILGTIGFAAPEQYGFTQSDFRSDIYALGIVINIMLTGAHPSQHLASGSLGHIVNRCTHVNPKKRYRDILHLMQAL